MRLPKSQRPPWLREKLERKKARAAKKRSLRSSPKTGGRKPRTTAKMTSKRTAPKRKPRRGEERPKRRKKYDPYTHRDPCRGGLLDWEW
jgi:hypothetical protein